MRLLLDTHALLWSLENDSTLSEQARKEIGSEQNLVFVSMASLWELTIKASLDKISLPPDFMETITKAGYEVLSVSLNHLSVLQRLPLIHRDPFDRMIVAQAQADQLLLVTRDEEIRKYDVSILVA